MLQVGPKKKNLKVKNFEEFQFRPRELVAHICHIYVHLGQDDDFCRAVTRDGRSYSHALFEQAELVLCKIHEPADTIASFSKLGNKIRVFCLLFIVTKLHQMHAVRTVATDVVCWLGILLYLAQVGHLANFHYLVPLPGSQETG